jgi:hypothetical protein
MRKTLIPLMCLVATTTPVHAQEAAQALKNVDV